MKSFHHSQFSLKAAFAFCVLVFTGCDLFEPEKKAPPEGVSGLESAWIGRPLDSLKISQSLAFRDGRLYITHRHATEPGTAVVDTGTGKIIEYYPHLLKPSGMAFTASGKLVVGEGSWGQPGGISVIDPSTKRIRQSVLTFDQDNVVTSADDRTYLIDRTLGVITGFSGNTPGQNVVLNVQTGVGSNPYGIAVSGGKGYVPRYNLSSLLILNDINQLSGGTRDSIDLSAYAHDSAGGVPRMAKVVAHDGYVFVALQRFNANYSAQDSGLVVVINAATKAIEKTITLNFKNPGSSVVRGGVWYIAGLGSYLVNDGGVEKIDLVTRTHAGTVVTEATLGGDVGSVVIAGPNAGYVTWSTDFFTTSRVKKFVP
jgi:hypothetical protein